MSDQNTPLPLDDSQLEETVTSQEDQNLEQNNQDTGITEQNQGQQQDDQVNEQQDDQLSRSERRQQRYAEKMADRLRDQSQQDAQFGRQLFSQDNNYQPLSFEEDSQYDIDQLQQDRQQYGRQNFNEGIRQGQAFYEAERFADRLEVDIDKVLSKREDIDDVTERMLVESYLDKVGAQERNGRIIIGNPNLRFRDFAEAKLKEIDDLVQVKLSQSTRNIAQQAANTGVRPNGASQGSVSNLSDNDLIQKVRESDADTSEGKKYLAEMRRRANTALGIQ